MAPELHLDPDRLRAHAAAIAGLSEELGAALHGAPVVDAALGAEQDRLQAAVVAAAREMVELGAALGAAASRADAAEQETVRTLGRLAQALGAEQRPA